MIWQALRGAVLQWSVRTTGLAMIATLTFYGLTWYLAGKVPNPWAEVVQSVENLRMIGDAIQRRDFWGTLDFFWGDEAVTRNVALSKTFGFFAMYSIIAARCCLMFAMFTVSFLIAIELLTFIRYGVPSLLYRLWRAWRDRRRQTVTEDGFGGARYEAPSDARDRMRQ